MSSRNTPTKVEQARTLFQEALRQERHKGFMSGKGHWMAEGAQGLIDAFTERHGAPPVEVARGFKRGVEWGTAQAEYILRLEAAVGVLRTTIHELHEDLAGLAVL